MRVIAGDFKGNRLRTVQGIKTRPTSDKVKETIFNMIGPYFSGGQCLDLFAGSGSLGLEALSRGMKEVVMVDKNQQAIKCIHRNVEHVMAKDKVHVLRMDSFKAIKYLSKKQRKFNLILLDPPYDEISIKILLERICLAEILSTNGLILAEHKETLTFAGNEYFNIIKEKIINKTTTITVLRSNSN